MKRELVRWQVRCARNFKCCSAAEQIFPALAYTCLRMLPSMMQRVTKRLMCTNVCFAFKQESPKISLHCTTTFVQYFKDQCHWKYHFICAQEILSVLEIVTSKIKNVEIYLWIRLYMGGVGAICEVGTSGDQQLSK